METGYLLTDFVRILRKVAACGKPVRLFLTRLRRGCGGQAAKDTVADDQSINDDDDDDDDDDVTGYLSDNENDDG